MRLDTGSDGIPLELKDAIFIGHSGPFRFGIVFQIDGDFGSSERGFRAVVNYADYVRLCLFLGRIVVHAGWGCLGLGAFVGLSLDSRCEKAIERNRRERKKYAFHVYPPLS